MEARLFVGNVLMLLLAGCSGDKISGPILDTSAIPANEYVVLSVLADSLFGHTSVSKLILDDSTRSGMTVHSTDSAMTQYLEYVHQHLPGLSPVVMNDFMFKNKKRTFIDAPGKIHPACIRASETDTLFPGLSVSRVGFDETGTQAPAYAGVISAPLAGAGIFFLLANERGEWRIIDEVIVWIS